MSRLLCDLDLDVKEKALQLLQRVKQEVGVTLIITHTLRTYEEQGHLYAKGRTLPGTIVTNAKPGWSWHNFGRAFDVAVIKGKEVVWNLPESKWTAIGVIGESLGLVWGGRFKGVKDLCHFEDHGDKTLAERRAAYEHWIATQKGPQQVQWN